MKQIHLHEEAVKYAREKIVPETDSEECETFDLVKHLEAFAKLMIEKEKSK